MNNKSALIFFLVLAAALVTWYLEDNKPDNSPEVVAAMNNLIEKDGRIKSYVWNYSNLAVGVLPDQVEPKAYARELCQKLTAVGAQGIKVQVVDVLKLQQSGGEDWQEIGFARCD